MPRTKHNHTRSGGWRSRTYSSWNSMLQRCNNPKSSEFAYYGGRGITVCRRWLTFVHFLADMGERPTGTTIERIENAGNYEPGNCRWATRKEQSSNTRVNRRVTFNGMTKTLQQWSECIGIDAGTLRYRLQRWPMELAMTTPKQPRRAPKVLHGTR